VRQVGDHCSYCAAEIEGQRHVVHLFEVYAEGIASRDADQAKAVRLALKAIRVALAGPA
jgi:hypothetical protein